MQRESRVKALASVIVSLEGNFMIRELLCICCDDICVLPFLYNLCILYNFGSYTFNDSSRSIPSK
jgi:hypothetical protein